MDKGLRSQRGLTLIELMVTVTIGMLLALAAAQFSMQWIHDAKVVRAQASLQHAFSTAKAIALQNNLAVTDDKVAASLCIQPSQLRVTLGGDCAATAVWSATVDEPVAIELGSASTGTCIAVGNLGIPVAHGGCVTELRYSISAGSTRLENRTLF